MKICSECGQEFDRDDTDRCDTCEKKRTDLSQAMRTVAPDPTQNLAENEVDGTIELDESQLPAPNPADKLEEKTVEIESQDAANECNYTIQLDSDSDIGDRTIASIPEDSTPSQTLKTVSTESIEDGLVVGKRSVKGVEERGSEIADYQLLQELGHGGMGIVYKARQNSLNRNVAIKRVKGKSAGSSKSRSKFLREASITSDLPHPNIVPIHDLGVAEDGGLYYAMKEVHGVGWDEIIATKSLEENLEIFLKVCDAIGFAHAKGVIHRDLKPENVMLGDFGEVLLMDWGLAAKLDDGLNGSGGSPSYMAPEMAHHYLTSVDAAEVDIGVPVGKHSDIYLLGAILFEIVVGDPPHSGDGFSGTKEVLSCLQNAKANRIDWQHLDDGALGSIVRKALETNPADRYKSVRDFQEAIREYQSHTLSIELTNRAIAELERAQETQNYESLSRAVFGFQDAVDMWPGNPQALNGLGHAKIAYAKCAQTRGDFDLGLSLVDPQAGGEQQQLHAELTTALEERNKRKHRLVVMRNLVLGLIVLLLVCGFGGWYLTEGLRQKAYQKELEATRQAERADKNAKQARANEKTARQNERRAKDAEHKARQLAEQEEIAKNDALTQKKRAESLLGQAQYGRFVSRIALADARIADNNPQSALDILTQIRDQRAANSNVQIDWEWRYLLHLCHPEVKDLDLGGTHGVAAFFVSGKQTATAATSVNGDSVVKIWSNGSQQPIQQLEVVNVKRLNAIQVSDDGRFVVAGGEAMTETEPNLFVWDAASGKVIARHFAHAGKIKDIAIHGNRFVTCGSGGALAEPRPAQSRLQLWKIDDRNVEVERRYFGHFGTVQKIAISDDGSMIAVIDASRDHHRIFLHDMDSEKALKRIRLDQQIHCLSFVPRNNNTIACGTAQNSILFVNHGELVEGSTVDLSGVPLPTFLEHQSPVQSLKFHQNGTKLVSGSRDGAIIVWARDANDTNSFVKQQVLGGHRSAVISLDWNAGYIASSSLDGKLRLWNLKSLQNETVVSSPATLTDASLSKSGKRFVLSSEDGHAKIYESSSGNLLYDLDVGHDQQIQRVYWHDESKRLFTQSNDAISIWDGASGKQIRRWKLTSGLSVFDVSDDGELLTVGANGSKPTSVWHVTKGRPVFSFDDHDRHISALCVIDQTQDHPGTVVVGLPNGNISCCDGTNGNVLWSNQGDDHVERVSQIEFEPSTNRIFSLSELGREIRVWSLQGELIKKLAYDQFPRKILLGSGKLIVLFAEEQSTQSSLQILDTKSWENHALDWAVQIGDAAITNASVDAQGQVQLFTSQRKWFQLDLNSSQITDREFNALQMPDAELVEFGGAYCLIACQQDICQVSNLPAGSTVQMDGGMVKSRFLNDHVVLTLATDGILRYWDVSGEAGELSSQVPDPNGLIQDFHVFDDDRICTVCKLPDGKFVVSILAKGRLQKLANVGNPVAITSAGGKIVVAEASLVHFWETESLEKLAEIDVKGADITSVAADYHGRFVAVGDRDGSVVILPSPAVGESFDRSRMIRLQSSDRAPTRITSIQFSKTGHRILAADALGSIVIWYFSPDLTQELLVIRGHSEPVHSLSFAFESEDNALLSSDSAKAIVRHVGSEDEKSAGSKESRRRDRSWMAF